jgi:hypothetical protein
MSNLELSQITEDYRINMPENEFGSATFLLNYHHDSKDMPLELRPLFEQADIVFHEQVAWSPMYLNNLNRIAQADPRTSARTEIYQHRLTELIAGSRVLQACWDVPAGHLSAQKYLRAVETTRPPVKKEEFEAYYDISIGRDKLALRTIGRQIDKAVTERKIPESPRILVIAGLSHLLLANAFKIEAPDEVTITSPFGEDITMSAPAEYVKQRLEGERVIDIPQLAARAVHEEILALKGVRPSHSIAKRAKMDSFPTPGY